MEALKIASFVVMGIIWLALVVIASVAPTEEQLAEYRKFKDSDVTAPPI